MAAAEWWFYHIEHTSLDAAIAPLIEKCLDRKWRVVVVAHDDTLERLNKSLWTFREDSFLPHGRAPRVGALVLQVDLLRQQQIQEAPSPPRQPLAASPSRRRAGCHDVRQGSAAAISGGASVRRR